MAENKQVVVSGPSIGLAGILTIVFVIMKCLGHLSWSWVWVFAPLWVSFGLGLAILGVILLVALIAYLVNK